MKRHFLVVLLLLTTGVFAQKKTANWQKKGKLNLVFNQSYFNDKWLGGETSNIATNINLDYKFNYKKGNWTWDNHLIASYGLTKIKGEGISKSDDRLEFNSILGKKMGKDWYYSTLLNFKTQMGRGEKEGTYISHFMSPSYLQIGLGMLYKKGNTFKLNFSPLTGKITVVDKQFTLSAPSFGVEIGESALYNIGASIRLYSKNEPFQNISFENILNLYSNYQENPQNIDIDYTLNVVLKINKYLSTNISFRTIYDDNTIKNLQVREFFGLGINYKF